MKTIATLAGILTFAATTTWLISSRGGDAPDPVASEGPRHPRGGTADHGARPRRPSLTRHGGVIHRDARSTTPDDPSPLAAPAPVEAPVEDLDEVETEQQQDLERAQVQWLEQTMGDEVRDTQWAPQAEAEIAEVARHVLPEGTTVSTHCGSTLCRLEIDTRDEAERDAAVDVLPQAVPWPSRGVFSADEHDPRRVIAFASREGYGLAEPAAP